MGKINMNELARAVTLREGGKENLSIAQVKEVIKATFDEISDNIYIGEYRVGDLLNKLEEYGDY